MTIHIAPVGVSIITNFANIENREFTKEPVGSDSDGQEFPWKSLIKQVKDDGLLEFGFQGKSSVQVLDAAFGPNAAADSPERKRIQEIANNLHSGEWISYLGVSAELDTIRHAAMEISSAKRKEEFLPGKNDAVFLIATDTNKGIAAAFQLFDLRLVHSCQGGRDILNKSCQILFQSLLGIHRLLRSFAAAFSRSFFGHDLSVFSFRCVDLLHHFRGLFLNSGFRFLDLCFGFLCGSILRIHCRNTAEPHHRCQKHAQTGGGHSFQTMSRMPHLTYTVPCFLSGRSSRFVKSISKAPITYFLVSAGAITVST